MTTIPAPICLGCARYRKQQGPKFTCDAFPDGIPADIMSREPTTVPRSRATRNSSSYLRTMWPPGTPNSCSSHTWLSRSSRSTGTSRPIGWTGRPARGTRTYESGEPRANPLLLR